SEISESLIQRLSLIKIKLQQVDFYSVKFC
ncbi:MAG: hypothetical protein ACI808_000390, partial [Paraglaciecola sp.]